MAKADKPDETMQRLREVATNASRVGRKCKTCNSPHRGYIDTLLKEGVSQYAISAALHDVLDISLSAGAIGNHRRGCLGIRGYSETGKVDKAPNG